MTRTQERTPEQRQRRREEFRRLRQRQAAAVARRQRTEELFWTGSKECPCCGCTLTIGNPLLPTHPRLVGEAGRDSIICRGCFDRIKADCERRSRDTRGRLPMPAEESEVVSC